MNKTTSLPVVIALALALAACGSEDDGGGTDAGAASKDAGAVSDAGGADGGVDGGGAGDDAGGGTDTGPGVQCGKGTTLVNGFCRVDEEALKPMVESVTLRRVSVRGAAKDVLHPLHNARLKLRLAVKGEAFEARAVVQVRSADGKSCTVGTFPVDHDGGDDALEQDYEEVLLVQPSCDALAGAKDLNLSVVFDPFLKTSWAQRKEVTLDESKPDAEQLAALFDASRLPMNDCEKVDAPAGGFACDDTVKVAKSPGKDVVINTKDLGFSGAGGEDGGLLVVQIEDLSAAIPSEPHEVADPKNLPSDITNTKAMPEGYEAVVPTGKHTPPKPGSLRGSGTSRPDIHAFTTYRVYGQAETEEVEDDAVVMAFAIRPANAAEDDAWLPLSTRLETEAKAGEDKTVEFLEETFLKGLVGVAEATLQAPVYFPPDTRTAVTAGDWKGIQLFDLRICLEADFDEKGSDDADENNCTIRKMLLTRQQVAPTVSGDTRLPLPPPEGAPKDKNPGGIFKAIGKAVVGAVNTVVEPVKSAGEDLQDFLAGTGVYSEWHYAPWLPKNCNAPTYEGYCAFNATVPMNIVPYLFWIDGKSRNWTMFSQDIGMLGAPFVNVQKHAFRWPGSPTAHVFEPGMGEFADVWTHQGDPSTFGTPLFEVVQYFYRPWDKPTAPSWLNDFLNKLRTAIQQAMNTAPPNMKSTLQMILDMLEGKATGAGSTFMDSLDWYKVGVYGAAFDEELVDFNFPLPLPNIPKKATKSTLVELSYKVLTFTIDTVPNENGLEFGLAVGISKSIQKAKKSKKKPGSAAAVTVELEAKAEAKIKLALTRKQATYDKYKTPAALPSECFYKPNKNTCYMQSPNNMNFYAAKQWCDSKGAKLYQPTNHRATTFVDVNGDTQYYKGERNISARYVEKLLKDTFGWNGSANVSKGNLFTIAAKTPDPLGFILNLHTSMLVGIGAHSGPTKHQSAAGWCNMAYKSHRRSPSCTVEGRVLTASLQAVQDMHYWMTGGSWRNHWIDFQPAVSPHGASPAQRIVNRWSDARNWYDLTRPAWLGFQYNYYHYFLSTVNRWSRLASGDSKGAFINSGTFYSNRNLVRYQDEVRKQGSNGWPWWSKNWGNKYWHNTLVRDHYHVVPNQDDPDFNHSMLNSEDYAFWTSAWPYGGSYGSARALCYYRDGGAIYGKPAESFTFEVKPGFEVSAGISAKLKASAVPVEVGGGGSITAVDATVPVELFGMRTKDNQYAQFKAGAKVAIEYAVLKFSLTLKFVSFVNETYEKSIYPAAWLQSAFSGKDYSKINETFEYQIFKDVGERFYCNSSQCYSQGNW